MVFWFFFISRTLINWPFLKHVYENYTFSHSTSSTVRYKETTTKLASVLGRMQPMSETNVVLFIYDKRLECDCLPAVELTVPLLQFYTYCTTFHHVTLFKGLVSREAVYCVTLNQQFWFWSKEFQQLVQNFTFCLILFFWYDMNFGELYPPQSLGSQWEMSNDKILTKFDEVSASFTENYYIIKYHKLVQILKDHQIIQRKYWFFKPFQ